MSAPSSNLSIEASVLYQVQIENRIFLASGGRQPTGTLQFLPFMEVEPQWTGKLTHAACQRE